MAHIPMDDIRELWRQTPTHSWSALHKTLQAHKGKTEGISDSLVDMMLLITRAEEQAGNPYPDSADQLYNVLNQGAEKMAQS
jgi:hypothetical protein